MKEKDQVMQTIIRGRAASPINTVSVQIESHPTSEIVVELYDLPGVSTMTYATSPHAIQRKQKEAKQRLQDASAAMQRDLKKTGTSLYKTKTYAIKSR